MVRVAQSLVIYVAGPAIPTTAFTSIYPQFLAWFVLLNRWWLMYYVVDHCLLFFLLAVLLFVLLRLTAFDWYVANFKLFPEDIQKLLLCI